MELPHVEQAAFQVDRQKRLYPVDATPNPVEAAAMNRCLELAQAALDAGNPPIGAVLLNRTNGRTWEATTIDKTVPHLIGHGETQAYLRAQPIVGDDLSDCSIISTAQLCNTCTTVYAEGNIGRIVYSLPRPVVFAVCGIMRPREINMPELLLDGDVDTTFIQGVFAAQALKLFGEYGRRRGFQAPPNGSRELAPANF